MCGIAGFVDLGDSTSEWRDTIEHMTGVLAHRGPDDDGHWVDAGAGVALGHRRLAVIDTSPAGHQPMASASGRHVIAYNGEIYNYRAVREELAAHAASSPGYRGQSDTEVLLAAVDHWGVADAVKRCVGMFAFALWDRRDRVLHLVRDRMGEKPLYYGWAGRVLLFGSELKALRTHPAWEGVVNPEAATLMMRYSYIPAPHSIYKGVYKLSPGTVLSVRAPYRPEDAEIVKYWSAQTVYGAGAAAPLDLGDAAATDALDELLRTAVGGQMIADVPIGAFLSSGVDSTLIVSLMQAQSAGPVRTFTIGSHDKAYDEADGARRIARHLGTEHTELYVSGKDAMAVIPKLPSIYDEPFADPSQIPTFLVAALARQHVTVSLSGDGADELFGGYQRYMFLDRSWRRARRVPAFMRPALAGALAAARPLLTALARVERALPSSVARLCVQGPARAQWLLSHASAESMFRDAMLHWKSPVTRSADSEAPSALTEAAQWAALPHFLDRAMFIDIIGYLPDDILVKVDRATMAVGLEARAPFLDHRVVGFAARLPLRFKIRDGRSKWLLRQVLGRYVPEALVAGPKRGFLVGFAEWLRGPLRDWAEALLDETRLRSEGFFDAAAVREKWEHHLADRTSAWNNDLWNVLMFQSWLADTSRPIGWRSAGAPRHR
jgi:asparagine synthase (glutamine-hydrolysing)